MGNGPTQVEVWDAAWHGGSKRMVASEIESFGVRVQDCNMLRFQSSSQGEVQIRMKRETGPEDQEKEKGRKGIGALLALLQCTPVHFWCYTCTVTFVGLAPHVHITSPCQRKFIRLGVRDAVSSFRFFFLFLILFLAFKFDEDRVTQSIVPLKPINWIWNPIGHGITLLMDFFSSTLLLFDLILLISIRFLFFLENEKKNPIQFWFSFFFF